jgi:hypothetical protein
VLELISQQPMDVNDPAQITLINLEKDAFITEIKALDGVTQQSLQGLLGSTTVGQPARGYAGNNPRNKGVCIGLLIDLAAGAL